MLARRILEILPDAVQVLRTLSVLNLEDSLTLPQLRILRLTDQGMGQSQMAETLGISVPAISKMIDSLSQKSFLVRETGVDKRCHKLKLTVEGKQLMKQVMKRVEKNLNEAIKGLSHTEIEDLEQGFIVLEKIVDKLKKVDKC